MGHRLDATGRRHGEKDPKVLLENSKQPTHSCQLTIETFVYQPDAKLEAQFSTGPVARRRLGSGYKFRGRAGRRDIFVDPRPLTGTGKKR